MNNHKFAQVTALEEILLRNYEPAQSNTPQVQIENWTATELMNDMNEHKLLPKAASVSYLGRLLQKYGFNYNNPQNIKVYKVVRKNKSSTINTFLNK